MAWYRYWKTWKGGYRSYTYKFFPATDEAKDDFEAFLEDDVGEWAWHEDHGVSDFYRAGYDKIYFPPAEWLETEVVNLQQRIRFLQEQLPFLQEQLACAKRVEALNADSEE